LCRRDSIELETARALAAAGLVAPPHQVYTLPSNHRARGRPRVTMAPTTLDWNPQVSFTRISRLGLNFRSL
jgi:hypothetical protein